MSTALAPYNAVIGLWSSCGRALTAVVVPRGIPAEVIRKMGTGPKVAPHHMLDGHHRLHDGLEIGVGRLEVVNR